MQKIFTILCFSICFYSCKNNKKSENLQIAFLADVHLQDIYGNFSDHNYKGVLNPKTGQYTLARTMQSQLKSTRLFNENYFAFLAALDDIVKKNVKYVVLPGDFSDDGQTINIRGLKRILNKYAKKHNIKFILTTGNHDPVRPFKSPAIKTDFLGKNGKEQIIASKKRLLLQHQNSDLPVVISKDIAKLGYSEILNELKDFGFFPKETDVYWETPFSSTYSYADYNFKAALSDSELKNRTYNNRIPDVSYLVEPLKNVWFLAIDANVYIPKKSAKKNALNPENYNSASIGYNNVLTHKKHLFKWVKSVTKRAKELGKTVIVFSHYPTIDFNDNATEVFKKLFGDKQMQSHRIPKETVSKAFSDAGVQVHFGGHMHINDTGVRYFGENKNLVNIQIPSLAAYIPAYKLLTIKNKTVFEVETIVMDSVSNFKTLFPLYEQEYSNLQANNSNNIWNKEILKVETYKDFTQFHLKELMRLRFLKTDWPIELKNALIPKSGADLLINSLNVNDVNTLNEKISNENLKIVDFKKWTGYDMIYDFYRLRSADELAFSDIGINRLKQYKIVCKTLEKSKNRHLRLWAEVFLKASNGAPSNHFEIDLESNTIKRINE